MTAEVVHQCPTCGGDGELAEPLGDCPDCVDGKMSWEQVVARLEQLTALA